MTTNHRHRPVKSAIRPFFGPVSTTPTRAAHGGICIHETCICGATRRQNRNGRHLERGVWIEDEA